MKKRILAFALTLAMVVGSLSMLSFVTFAEEPEPATEIVSAAEPIAIGDVATVAADYNIADKNVAFTVTAENLETLTLKVGGYVTTVTYAPSVAVDAASAKAGVTVAVAENVTTVTIPANLVSVYTNNEGNAVADVEIYIAEEEFKGTFVMKPVTYSKGDVLNVSLPLSFHNTTSNKNVPAAEAPAGLTFSNTTAGSQTIEFTNGTVLGYNGRFYISNLGGHMSNDSMHRAVNWNIKIEALKAYEFEKLGDVPYNNANYNYIQLDLCGGGNPKTNNDVTTCTDNDQILVNIINTEIDGTESLVLVYQSGQGRMYRIPLNVKPDANTELEIMYTVFDNRSGQISVNGNTLVREDYIWTRSQVWFSGTNGSSGIYSCVYRSSADSAPLKVTFSDVQFYRSTNGNIDAKNEDILNIFDKKAIDNNGTVELSYVQETKSFASVTNNTPKTSPTKSGNSAYDAETKTFSITDTAGYTAVRHYNQVAFQPLGEYGNRVITYKVNVGSLAAYDFSNGGTLSGDAKYKDNINSKYAYLVNPGIGGDISASAFEKIYIGAIGKVNAYYDYYAASVFALVNDTTDGLVLVHTSSDGTETVIPVGKKFAQDITIKLTWNANDTGSIKVDTDEAVALTDCKTVYADLSEKGSSVQCYYSSYPSCWDGYVGLNLIRSNATYTPETTYSSVSMQVEATVSNPLDVRFVATVDTLNAKEVGFEINLKDNAKVVKKSTDTVYSSINANVDGELNTITAADGKYFVALTVNGVPATGTVTLVVKPYLTYGGNTTYGTAYEVTYVDGVYAGCVAAN